MILSDNSNRHRWRSRITK